MEITSTLAVLLVALATMVAAIALAYLPLRAITYVIGRNIVAPIRNYIERQRERRRARRETPDRRKVM